MVKQIIHTELPIVILHSVEEFRFWCESSTMGRMVYRRSWSTWIFSRTIRSCLYYLERSRSLVVGSSFVLWLHHSDGSSGGNGGLGYYLPYWTNGVASMNK